MREFDAQEAILQERRKRGAMMYEDAQQLPQGRMVGRAYIAPNALEYLASGLRGLGGLRQQDLATQELKDLQTQRTEASNKALADFLRQSQGAPAQATGQMFQTGANEMGDESATVPQWQAAQAPNLRGAYASLLQSPDTGMRQAGMQGLASMPKMEADAAEREASRQFRIEQLNQQHQQRMEMLSAQNASREQMAEANRQHQIQMKQMFGALANQQPYFQPLQTAQGVMAFNARTGKVEPVSGANNQPVIGAANDPALQANIAGAKKTATEQAESQANAKTEARKADMFLQQLDQAEQILKQGPTQSGAGAVADTAGRVFGISTPGAQRAGQLEALSGWLVANVPRMEGPQSNFDVQNYMTMAGKIGDRTVPVKERMAALSEVRRLQEKYKTSAESRTGQTPTNNAPSVAPQDQAALDWANANPNDPRSVAIKQRLGVR